MKIVKFQVKETDLTDNLDKSSSSAICRTINTKTKMKYDKYSVSLN